MDKNKRVKFTIIIPTRERCDVLESSLKTCVTQEYDNFEIIVSDNFSQDNTRKVVESFRDSRIRYINTGKRVSMTDNWEFALAHVDGDYVTFIGDDDGLMPGALAELNEIIKQTSAEAISCKPAVYFWSDYLDESKRNTLVISLRKSLIKRNSKEMLMDVINFRRSHEELPLLYRGLVSYAIIKRIKQESGRFFHSMVPDIYAAISLACVLESYYYSFKSYVISGASHHSIGASASALNSNHEVKKIFISENNMPIHSKLVFAASSPIIVADSFLHAQDHIFFAKYFKLEIKKCIKAAIKEAVYFPEEKYKSVIEAVRKIACLNQIESYASKVISEHKKLPTRLRNPVLGFNIVYGQMVVDAAKFGVRDVYEAAILCKHILTLKKFSYFSLGGIIKTTLSLIKREIFNKI